MLRLKIVLLTAVALSAIDGHSQNTQPLSNRISLDISPSRSFSNGIQISTLKGNPSTVDSFLTTNKVSSLLGKSSDKENVIESLDSLQLSNRVAVDFLQTRSFSNLLQISIRQSVPVAEDTLLATREALPVEVKSQDELKAAGDKVKVAEPQLAIAETPNYYALVIGISSYQFSGKEIVNLDYPTVDAKSLVSTLQEYSFENDKIKFLANPTRADIIDELDNLSRVITDKDNFLIFYAGHGYWDEHLSLGYWLPADAVPGKRSSWISNSNLKDYVSGIKAKHTLLISDACFSGSIFKTRSVADPLNEYGVAKLYRLPSRKAMTSGNMNTTPDRSKFFEFLNKRLIQNDQKYLTSRELFYSLYNAVINNTNTVPQYGVIQDTGDEGGDFIFIRRDVKN
jgi:hypothetical protein